MKKHTVELTFERETKNTRLYLEKEVAGEDPVIRSVYLQKSAAGNPAPEKIKVTIEAA